MKSNRQAQLATSTCRCGSMLFEIAAAIALLTLVMTMVTQVVLQQAATRRFMEQHQFALQEASNAMERVLHLPFEQLTAEHAQNIAQNFMEENDRLSYVVKISQSESELPARKIEVTVSISANEIAPKPAVRLVAWRFRAQADVD